MEITKLTQQENESFSFHRQRVSDNLLGAQKLLWDAAESLKYIRDNRLYRVEYKTFEDFCLAEYGIVNRHVNRIIASETVIQNLKMRPIGLKYLPTTESQARPLAKLEAPLQREAWRETVERHGDNITAAKVKEVADEYSEANAFMKEAQQPPTFDRPPMTEAEILAKAKEIRQKKNEERKQDRISSINQQAKDIEDGKLPELNGFFNVVSIDPPWEYSERGGSNGASLDPHGNRGTVDYPTMTVNEIKNIDLPLLDDAVVFLWTTHAFLRDAFDILDAWGLSFKAVITWDKEIMGMGRNIRLQCEFCLMAYNGKPFINGASERDIIRAKRREHSRKPDEFFDMVDRMCFGRKLEYFSREAREGWEVFGNDTSKF